MAPTNIICSGALFYATTTKRFLFLQRTDDKTKGLWGLCGGMAKYHESAFEGLKREIREELDIEIEIKKKLGEENFRDNFVNVNLHYYICSHKSGKIDLKEHQESAWVTKEEFKFYEFAEGDKDIISLL